MNAIVYSDGQLRQCGTLLSRGWYFIEDRGDHDFPHGPFETREQVLEDYPEAEDERWH